MNVKKQIDKLPLRSLVLLIALLAVILVTPFHSYGWVASTTVELLYLGVFCVAGYLLNSTRKWVVAYLFVAGPAFLFGLISATLGDTPTVILIRDILLLVMQLLLISAVLKFALFHRDAREIDRILAGVCGYLTLALFWAKLYAIQIHHFSQKAFRFSSGEFVTGEDGSLLYFSLVTLTTLGYGDITPANDWARVLAALQAVAGTLYLAVLIASLMSKSRMSRKEPPQKG